MRRFHSDSPTRRNPTGGASPKPSARKGSTIVVVIALLLALTFLGIVGYTIGTQEHGNATYFSDASKNVEFGVSRDVLFDWALRQVILGPRNPNQFDPAGEMQSALHGGHMSLMASMFGSDLTPYTGTGVNLGMNGADIFVDQDRDPTQEFNDLDGDGNDDSPRLMELNRAPFANGFGVTLDQTNYPEPDVDYTYWDINSPFLAYMNDAHFVGSAAPGQPTRKVVLPSFHRPQYLRSLNTVPPADWYTDPLTQGRVLRPHALDLAVAPNGAVTNTRRFIQADDPILAQMQSGPFPFLSNSTARVDNLDMDNTNDGIWDGIWSGGQGQDNLVEYDADPDGDGTREAVWLDLGFPMQVRENADGTVTKFVPMFGITIYDADALLNLNAHGNSSGLDSAADNTGAPLGSTFTEPFGDQVVGLGNDGLYGTPDDVYDTRFISRSNQGARVSEVNPQWGFDAGLADGPLDQHERFLAQYGRNTSINPLSQTEVANLEWWWLMTGRPELDSGGAVQNLHAGRYGEVDVMSSAFTGGGAPITYPGPGSTFDTGTPTPGFFGDPFFGDTRDDNNTAYRGFSVNTLNGPLYEGGTNPFYNANYRVFPSNVLFDHWRTPLDLRGRGRYTVNGTNGKDRLLRQAGLHQFPAYAFYQDNRRLGLLSNDLAAGVNYELMPGFLSRLDVDEPEEMILVPSQARSDLDGIYGAGENASLHLTNNDQTQLGLTGRVRDLAPSNFDGMGAEDRRSAFTTTSWDVKSFAKPRYTQTGVQFRSWEFTDRFDAVNNVPGTDGIRETFPPEFGSTYGKTYDPINPTDGQDPFRPAVRELLQVTAGNTVEYLQRKLSVNEICDYDKSDPTNWRLRFRPLTPHPTVVPDPTIFPTGKSAANPIADFVSSPPPTRPEEIANADEVTQWANQEYMARRDRQQLCRDIYVLLYTFCGRNGGDTTMNVTNTSWTALNSSTLVNDGNGTLGVPSELLEMAQFAVNLVDRLDPDDVITKFEFDIDLSNEGWNPNDDPFDDSLTTRQSGETDRFVVYGVEQQELTLNEAQVVYTRRLTDATADHPATQWKDDVNRHFTYVEFENITPNEIDLSTGNWQLVVTPRIASSDMSVVGQERRLTFFSSARQLLVGTGTTSRFLIGTASHTDITPDHPNDDPRSHVLIDEQFDPMTPPDPTRAGDFTRICPFRSLNQPAPLAASPGTLDLLQHTNVYRVNSPLGPGYGDGAESTATKQGVDLLYISNFENSDEIDEDVDRQKEVEFVLRRRMNPNRVGPTATPAGTDAAESADNPWITVDKIIVPIHVFELANSNVSKEEIQQQITGKNPNIPSGSSGGDYDNSFKSIERKEPIAGLYEPGVGIFKPPAPSDQVHFHFINDLAPTNAPVYAPRNSLGIPNPDRSGNLLARYELYQTQTDRDFASVGELMNIPLYGPASLTANFSGPSAFQFNANQLAAARFLEQGGTGSQWQRLFEFLEVPDRSHRHYDSDAYNSTFGTYVRPPFVEDVESRFFYRKPGRIQLNTLRHPLVLGGLLDDIEVMQPDNFLTSQDGSGREWFTEFIRARDGRDPDPEDTTGFFMPGLPVAKPYRTLSYTGNGTDGRDYTVLRDRPGTTSPKPQLFEVMKSDGSSLDDPTLRYRLLDKVLNNSTNRSNVFLVFIQVDFFEAVEQQDGMSGETVVRVGGKLANSPAYRGFFVVDRSKVLEVLSERDSFNQPVYDPSLDFLPPSSFLDPNDGANKFNYSFNQDFDYRQLILHRQTIN